MNEQLLTERLPWLNRELLDAFLEVGTYAELNKGEELLAPGGRVDWVPVVLEGLVKVADRNEEKELLLYYIIPSESCVMSFFAGMNGERSKVLAVVEEDCKLFLIPSNQINALLDRFPQLNRLFYGQYQHRYEELIATIRHLLFDKMDKRLLDHLRRKAELIQSDVITDSHRALAKELGTAREVITRTLKKLEAENRIRSSETGIEILRGDHGHRLD